VLDALLVRLLLATLVGWLDQRPQEAMAYLFEENRILRRHVRGRIRLTDVERRRLAVHGHSTPIGTNRISQDASLPSFVRDQSRPGAGSKGYGTPHSQLLFLNIGRRDSVGYFVDHQISIRPTDCWDVKHIVHERLHQVGISEQRIEGRFSF